MEILQGKAALLSPGPDELVFNTGLALDAFSGIDVKNLLSWHRGSRSNHRMKGKGEMNEKQKNALMQKAFQLGFDYEKIFRGCSQCTIAAVQDTLDIREDMTNVPM